LAPLDQALFQVAENRLSRPTVALTFDDGFASVIHYGSSILREFGARATLFLPTRCVLNQQHLWFTKVISYLRNTPLQSFYFLGRRFDTSTYQSKVFASQEIQGFLKRLHPSAIEFLLLELAQETCVDPDLREDVFNLVEWSQCENGRSSGEFDFGAHSASHAIHTQLDFEDLSTEIAESTDAIGSLKQSFPLIYAYPNGQKSDFSEVCRRLLIDRSVSSALTTIPGWNVHLRNPFSVYRFCIGPNTDVVGILNSVRWRLLSHLS